ncbi:MAG: leucine-rich repeat domain-containing protein, partial [Clostridia bacterium]|nr:leucine-rich repeat domain-containing protein [Clostridia bacterium]
MKKKYLILALASAAAIIGGVAAAGCTPTCSEHSYGAFQSDGNATCTEDGTKSAVCNTCGEKVTVPDEGSAGHLFANYEPDGNATCAEDGTKTAVCTRCDEKKTVADEGSGGHKFDNGNCTACGITDLNYELAENGEEWIVHGIKDINSNKPKNVVIPAEHEGKPVAAIAGMAFYNDTFIESVTLPDTIAEVIGFEGCSSLKSINIPDNATKICNSAFSRCAALESIDIPDSVTEIGWSAFYDCKALKTAKIPGSVKKMGGWVFAYCTSLESVELEAGVTEIGEEMFSCCENLTNVKIGEGVTKVGALAFSSCSSLEEIEFPEGVTELGRNVFSNCISLKQISLPDSLSYVHEEIFYNCDDVQFNEVNNGLYLGNKNNPCVMLYSVKDNSVNTFTINEGTSILYYRSLYAC